MKLSTKHAALLISAILCASMAQAGETERAVRVIAVGEVEAKPEIMEVRLLATATAGTANNALTQCLNKATAATAEIEKLGAIGATIEVDMPAFSSPSAGNPYMAMQQEAPPAGIKVSITITVKVHDIENKKKAELAGLVSKILDAANQTGVGIASPTQYQALQGLEKSPVAFKLNNEDALREKAVQAAITKAKEDATTLEAAGVKLGGLLRIEHGPNIANAETGWAGNVLQNILGCGSAITESATPDRIVLREAVTLIYAIAE